MRNGAKECARRAQTIEDRQVNLTFFAKNAKDEQRMQEGEIPEWELLRPATLPDSFPIEISKSVEQRASQPLQHTNTIIP